MNDRNQKNYENSFSHDQNYASHSNIGSVSNNDINNSSLNNNNGANGKHRALSFDFNFLEFVQKCRHSRKLVLLVVFIALFFDNMLLTTIGKLEFI